eukprot:446844-Prymnesium_polylepis.1
MTPSGREQMSDRALTVTGGTVVVMKSILHGQLAGAVVVQAASLTMMACVVRDSCAATGGGLLVGSGADVLVVASNFTNNSASVSGGALQVMSMCLPNRRMNTSLVPSPASQPLQTAHVDGGS